MEGLKNIAVVLEHSIGIANRNDFDGIDGFKKFKNKRSSGYYLLHKIKGLKIGDFYYNTISELANKAKSDVLNQQYTKNVKSFISFIQEVKL